MWFSWVQYGSVLYGFWFSAVLCCLLWELESRTAGELAKCPFGAISSQFGSITRTCPIEYACVRVCIGCVCVCVRCACDSVCVQVSLFAILCQWRTLAGSGCRTRHTEAMATMSVGFSWATASLLCSFYQREWVSVRLSKSVYTCVCGCVLKHFLCLLISHLFPFRYFELFSSASASAWN